MIDRTMRATEPAEPGASVALEEPSRAAEAYEFADLFASQARRRVDALFHELWSNDDNDNYQAAQKVLDRRYTWFEADIVDPRRQGADDPRGDHMLTLTRIDELKARTGEELGVSDWHEVTQDAIDAFADATGDRQWIHTDPERARSTRFGGTIAHGYYTLSLAPVLLGEVVSLDFAIAVNYGLDKLRFPAPLPVGDRVPPAGAPSPDCSRVV